MAYDEQLRRLRHVQPSSRPREIQLLGHRDEIPQLPQLNRRLHAEILTRAATTLWPSLCHCVTILVRGSLVRLRRRSAVRDDRDRAGPRSGRLLAVHRGRGPGGDRRWRPRPVALSVGGSRHSGAPTLGIVLALVSGAAYAAYTVIAKRLLDDAEPVEVMGAAFGVGSLLLLPVLLLGDTQWLHTTRGVELAAYLAVGPTIVGYLLFARGLRQLRASETTTIVLAEPVTATILGVAVLHQPLGVAAIVGVLLVLAGLGLLSLPSLARQPA